MKTANWWKAAKPGECIHGLKLEDECGECAAGEPLSGSQVRMDELEMALSAVVHHWDEFGPEHGFDETIDRARKALRGRQ